MKHYEQNIDSAFADAVGVGADRARYAHWLETLKTAVPRILAKPQREAAPVFALPARVDDLTEIEEIAARIAGDFSTLVVVGMGGSSLSGETLLALAKPGALKVHFLDNIDPQTMEELTERLPWRETAFLIISKSGNTLETLALASVLVRVGKQKLENISGHFFAVTIPDGNALHRLAKAHDMRVVAHDVDLGGRFSVLSSVGLIPALAAGLDVRALRAGAACVMADYEPAVQSAALHMALMEKKVRVNVMMHYDDRMGALASWYRQCWSESLGKCDGVMTPVRSRGATDQHSQLQLYLDGPKDKLFSLMMLECAGQGARIDVNGIQCTLGDLMGAEQRATLATLTKRGCPARSFTMKKLDEETLGALLMHFMLEVIFTAELLGVNAFDQPAVEESKVLTLGYLAEMR